MDSSKNYYAILGVLPSAEPVVIRAAYRALAMQYHPDKWEGERTTAEARMRLINEAYEVLSNEQKRKNYDKARQKAGFEEYEFETETAQAFRDAEDSQHTAWQIALDYYPDLDVICSELRKTSSRLAFAFRTTMLETKRFSERKKVADDLEKNFLQTYFGKNPRILQFARTLIAGGHKAAAKELNRAISVLGDNAEDEVVIERIQLKFFNKDLSAAHKRSARDLAETLLRTHYVTDAVALVEKLGGSISYIETPGFMTNKFDISVRALGESRHFQNDYDMTQWVIAVIVPKVFA